MRKGCARTSANENRNFTSVFGDRTSFRAKGLRPDPFKIAILPQFLAIEHHFVRKGCDRTREIAILLQFLAFEPRFVPKGSPDLLQIAILLQFLAIEHHFVRNCARTSANENRNFTAVFGDRTSFRAKGLRPDPFKIAILPQFLAIERHFVRKGCVGPVKSQFFIIFLQFLAIEHRFVRNGCVSCRLVVTAPRLKREIDKKERARGQERM